MKKASADATAATAPLLITAFVPSPIGNEAIDVGGTFGVAEGTIVVAEGGVISVSKGTG